MSRDTSNGVSTNKQRDTDELPKRCRGDFPLLQTTIDGLRITYFDSAATSLKPRQVIDEVSRYYTNVSANIHRGAHVLSEQASADFEDVRSQVAQWTGFQSNEVVFTANTTASINIVAGNLKLSHSDIVLVPFDSHHSAMLPWRRQTDVRYIPVDHSGRVDLSQYAEMLRLRPKIVVLSHCSNVSGVYAPVEKMAEMAKGVGAVTVIDAAQSIGHRRISCQYFDFLAFSAHKMLGPTGVGILCGRYEQLQRLDPPYLGGGVVDWVDSKSYTLRKLPHSLEAGTPAIASVYGLGAAIKYLSQLGHTELDYHDRALSAALIREALKRPYIRVLGPLDSLERSAIVSFTVDGIHNLKEFAKILGDSYGVLCRTGHMCAQPFVDRFTADEVLRVSGYIYNDGTDIKSLFSALDSVYDVAKVKK